MIAFGGGEGRYCWREQLSGCLRRPDELLCHGEATSPRNTERVSFCRLSVSASHSLGITRVELLLLTKAEEMEIIE